MTDETGLGEGGVPAESSGDAGSGTKPRKAQGYQQLAEKYMRRAVRALGDEEEPSPRADFYLRAANVYATLELARSFRSSQERGD